MTMKGIESQGLMLQSLLRYGKDERPRCQIFGAKNSSDNHPDEMMRRCRRGDTYPRDIGWKLVNHGCRSGGY